MPELSQAKRTMRSLFAPILTSALRARFFVFLMLVPLTGVANAKPPFWEIYRTYYKIDPDQPTGQAKCKNCHAAEGNRRNAYGKELAKLVKMSENNMLTTDMLKQVEGNDSDGDGWTNGDEIKNGYLPGDPASHPAGKPGDPILPAPKVAGASAASSAGPIPNHSFHPAFIHFPIGLFLFGVFMEFYGIWKKNPDFGKVAQWNLQGALCSMGVVVPTGVAAWLRGGHKLEGPMLIHLIFAVSSVLLIWLSISMRKKLGGDNQGYHILLILTALAITIAGHYGGVMVYG